jgi:hypothetical protein
VTGARRLDTFLAATAVLTLLWWKDEAQILALDRDEQEDDED